MGRSEELEDLLYTGNHFVFPPSGWRHGQSGKSAQCVKLASAGKRLSPCMGEGARSPRTPGEREEELREGEPPRERVWRWRHFLVMALSSSSD